MEILITDKQIPTLRTIVRHGLEDCDDRLEHLAREKLEAARKGHKWLPESIPMQVYLDAKQIVQREKFLLKEMHRQLNGKKGD